MQTTIHKLTKRNDPVRFETLCGLIVYEQKATRIWRAVTCEDCLSIRNKKTLTDKNNKETICQK